MVIYSTEIQDKSFRRQFKSYDDLMSSISNFGSLQYNGESIRYLLYEDDIEKLKLIKDMKEDIVVVTKASNISILHNMISKEHFSPSKYDLIINELNSENIQYENDKTIKLLMKVIPTNNLHQVLLDIAKKNNYYISSDFLKTSFYFDKTVHPVNVLVSVLTGKGYKAMLSECRLTYTDKAIRTVILDYLRKALNIIVLEYAGRKVKHNKISIFGQEKITNLFECVATDNNLERSLIKYGERSRRTKKW